VTLWKTNWRDVEPILEFEDTCYVRYLLRRRDRLTLRKGLKVTTCLEWVARMVVLPEKKMMYHTKNVEETLYVLVGRGVVKSGNFQHEVETCDAIHIPAMAPRTLWSTVEHQPLIFNSYAASTPPDSKADPEIMKVKDEHPATEKITIRNWLKLPSSRGHSGTCWGTGVFSRGDPLTYIGFNSLMSVPEIVSYHRHNVEATYYIHQGVGGEEQPCKEGDLVYMPPETGHQAWTTLPDQPLNVFCVGVPVPWDAKSWNIDGLPHTE